MRSRQTAGVKVPLFSTRQPGVYVQQIIWVYLDLKNCDIFLCFMAVIFLGSIVLTSHSLLCVLCLSSAVNLRGSFTEEGHILYIYILLTPIHFLFLGGILIPNFLSR